MLYSFQENTTLLLPVLLCTALVLYSLDLANLRNASFMANWLAFVVLTVTNAYDIIRNNNGGLFYCALEIAVESLLLACWVRPCVIVFCFLSVRVVSFSFFTRCRLGG